jgi:death on curing protein
MDFLLLPTELVDRIHDSVLNPGELSGRAGDKSLDGALARVENRLAYGMIEDVFDLAAAYCVAVAQGHCFNDGNKRTAFRVMQVCLDLHGLAEPKLPEDETGRIIIRVAQGMMDEGALAEWLRGT